MRKSEKKGLYFWSTLLPILGLTFLESTCSFRQIGFKKNDGYFFRFDGSSGPMWYFKVWIEFSSERASAGGASATWKPLQNPLHREESSWIGFNVSVKKMMINIILTILIVILFMLIKLIITCLLLKVESSWIRFNVSATRQDFAELRFWWRSIFRVGWNDPNQKRWQAFKSPIFHPTLHPACTEFHDHDTSNSESEMSDAAKIFPSVRCREHVKRKDMLLGKKETDTFPSTDIPALNTQCGKKRSKNWKHTIYKVE